MSYAAPVGIPRSGDASPTIGRCASMRQSRLAVQAGRTLLADVEDRHYRWSRHPGRPSRSTSSSGPGRSSVAPREAAFDGAPGDRGGVDSSRRSSPGCIAREAIDGCERHGLVREHLAPFAERLVGGNQQGVALVAAADQFEQHALRGRFSRHASKLRFYLNYSSGPRLIFRTHPPQQVLCEIAVFIPPYYRISISQLL
jgi:hypothetical protein